jgi:hypothetical protein
LRKTDPGLTRNFGAPRTRFVDFRAAIPGTAASRGLSWAPACFPGPDHEFPGAVVSVNQPPYGSDEFVGTLFRHAQYPRGIANGCWPAIIDFYRLRHRLIIVRLSSGLPFENRKGWSSLIWAVRSGQPDCRNTSRLMCPSRVRCDPAENLNLVACDKLVIANPKRGAAVHVGRDRWFPYYAGFSSEFARQLVASSSLAKGSTVMDPWNGSGTTTSSAVLNGYKALGFDLNPVMAVVAKARLLPQSEVASIAPLLADILKKAALNKSLSLEGDPLRIWFAPNAATTLRRVERAIYGLLVSGSDRGVPLDSIQEMSCLATFFYVALFRAVRSLLLRFKGSNPTWIMRPSTVNCRIRPAALEVRECFANHVAEMLDSSVTPGKWGCRRAEFTVGVASSENLPVRRGVIDLVLSSPPYCTRIDYGVATSAELAVLSFPVGTQLRELRGRFIGTPTIHAETPDPDASWGNTCLALLERIRNHSSKAAKTYYYKTYVQYFAAMARSFSEVGRCLKSRAQCILVVQDSYFKDTHIDLATIFAEMADSAALTLCRQVDFPIGRTFGSINLRSRNYRKASSATESVLCFARDSR